MWTLHLQKPCESVEYKSGDARVINTTSEVRLKELRLFHLKKALKTCMTVVFKCIKEYRVWKYSVFTTDKIKCDLLKWNKKGRAIDIVYLDSSLTSSHTTSFSLPTQAIL